MAVRKVLCHINNMCRGGAERVMSVLIDSMVSDGIEVTLVTLDKAEDEYTVPDTVKRIEIDKIVGSNNKITRFVARANALRKTIREEKPDLVLSFCSKENFRAAVAMKGIKTPLLVSVRSNPEEHYKSKLLTSTIASRADGWVLQSQGAKNYFAKNIQDKSRIICNPIDKSYFKVAANLDEDRDEIRIVTAGRLRAVKNQIHLVKSFIRIANKYPNANLYLYGKDDVDGSSDLLKSTIEEYSMQSRIKLMGACDKWAEELIKSDIFVMTSLFEGMPNALLEAMTVGVPVISTNCPCGVPAELIKNHENGIIVPINDVETLAEELEKLINEKDLRIKLATNAKAIGKMVETESVYAQWKEYMELLV